MGNTSKILRLMPARNCILSCLLRSHLIPQWAFLLRCRLLFWVGSIICQLLSVVSIYTSDLSLLGVIGIAQNSPSSSPSAAKDLAHTIASF